MTQLVHILLQVQLNPQGGIRSTHRPLSGQDEDTMAGWPSGGLVQVAYAMTIEALRREAYTMAITQLSGGAKVEDLTADEIERLTRAHLIEMADKFAPDVAREVLVMLQKSEAEKAG